MQIRNRNSDLKCGQPDHVHTYVSVNRFLFIRSVQGTHTLSNTSGKGRICGLRSRVGAGGRFEGANKVKKVYYLS